jgi:hypothetical protein
MKKALKIMLAVMVVALVVSFAWAQSSGSTPAKTSQSPAATGVTPGKGAPPPQRPMMMQGSKMKEVMDKYKNDKEFQGMIQEIKEIRKDQRKKVMELRKEGKRPDREQIMKLRDEEKIKLDAIEKKYGAKYPDFFKVTGEIRKERMERMKNDPKFGKMKGKMGKDDPNRAKLVESMKKYKDDPDFKKMIEERRAASLSLRQYRNQMKAEGKKMEPEELSKRVKAHQDQMSAIEKKYGAKFPDYFKAVKEIEKTSGPHHMMKME